MQGCLGLVAIIVVGALIANSGAGTKIMNGLNQLEGDCYSSVGQAGHGIAGVVCPVVGDGVRMIDRAATSVGDAIRNGSDNLMQRIMGHSSGSAALQDYIRQLSGTAVNIPGFESLMSSSKELVDKMRQGPQGLPSGASAGEQVRSALDSFSIGQQYLGQGDAGQAMPWLQQGAATPGGYGLLSQMTLGNMYSQGTGGIAANPNIAGHYYSQAQQSMEQLQRSSAPQAKQMLNNLPVSPQQMQQQLNAAVAQLKGR